MNGVTEGFGLANTIVRILKTSEFRFFNISPFFFKLFLKDGQNSSSKLVESSKLTVLFERQNIGSI